MTDDEKFLAEFEGCRLPEAEWHHKQHIRVAYLYLRRHGFEAAMDKIRAGIKAQNAAHKVPESLTRGYHETMTRAWLHLVHLTLCEYGPEESSEIFYEKHPQLAGKKSLRFFYSAERIKSLQAKNEFVEPDLTALPRSGKVAVCRNG